MILPGSRVRLHVPENPTLHGHVAEVESLREWGAFVRIRAAATGQFRALFSEMEPLGENGHSRDEGNGEECPTCGGMNMARSGTCLCCQDCGSTTGCS